MSIDQPIALSETRPKLQIKEVFKRGWQKVYGSKKTFFLAGLIYLMAYAVISLLTYIFFPHLMSNFARSLFMSLFSAGFVYLGLRKAFEKSIEPHMLFQAFYSRLGLNVFAVALLAYLIVFAAILIIALSTIFIVTLLVYSGYQLVDSGYQEILFFGGLILGFLFACYFIIKMIFTIPIMIAQKAGPLTAISKSFKATKGNFWRLVGLIMLGILISLGSVLTLCIGFIWTFPWLVITSAEAYKMVVGDKFIDSTP